MNGLLVLKTEWKDFFEKNNARGCSDYFFNLIMEQYAKGTRYYHTFEGHIAQCVLELKPARHLCEDPDFVFFELINHDAVYEAKGVDEEKSANFAFNLASQMFLHNRYCHKNGLVILATKHDAISSEIDARIGADIDLTIFGKSIEEFDEYEKNIRREYSWVPEEEFRKKRKEILQKFLDKKPSIYYTNFFREKYETQARKNLERSIERLSR